MREYRDTIDEIEGVAKREGRQRRTYKEPRAKDIIFVPIDHQLINIRADELDALKMIREIPHHTAAAATEIEDLLELSKAHPVLFENTFYAIRIRSPDIQEGLYRLLPAHHAVPDFFRWYRDLI